MPFKVKNKLVKGERVLDADLAGFSHFLFVRDLACGGYIDLANVLNRTDIKLTANIFNNNFTFLKGKYNKFAKKEKTLSALEQDINFIKNRK